MTDEVIGVYLCMATDRPRMHLEPGIARTQEQRTQMIRTSGVWMNSFAKKEREGVIRAFVADDWTFFVTLGLSDADSTQLVFWIWVVKTS